MTRYAVRHTCHEFRAIAVYDEQAEAMEERGEPMIYQDRRRAWAIARRLNRAERDLRGYQEGVKRES